MCACNTRFLIPWEFPRLCRGGSRSLTFSGVVPGCPSTKLRLVSRQSTRTWSCIDGRVGEPKSQQVGVQIPRCFHSQVPPLDVVCATAPVSWRGVPQAGGAKREPDRGRAFDARPCPHDDVDSTEIRRGAGGRLFVGQSFWARGY